MKEKLIKFKKEILIACLSMIAIYFVIVKILGESEYTDNAYLKSDIIVIKPKVTGYILDVLVKDNQVVKEGDLIALIDDKDFKLKVSLAESEVEVSQIKIAALIEKIKIQDIDIENSKIKEDSTKNTLDLADKELKRAESLIKDRAISQQDLDKKREAQKNSLNAYDSAKADTLSANALKNVLALELSQAKNELTKNKATLELSKIDLENTKILSPVNGKVSTRMIQKGQLASDGNALGYVIAENIWVVANYKETQVGKMKTNQSVKINVDSLPGKTFNGKVESLSPATGAEFSILPPENATGNFTKIVQRVPVKIIFDNNQDLSNLIPGLSCEVKVYTN